MKHQIKKFMAMAVAGCFLAVGAATVASAKESKKLVVAIAGQVLSLDTQMDTGTQSNMIASHIYEGLVRKDEKNNIYPWLAEKWEVSADKVTWTFYLRKGVKFQDNADFNAAAVQKSFNRLLDKASGSNRRYLYTFIKQVNVLDDYTVQFITEAPKASFLNLLAYNGAYIISPRAIDKWGKALSNYAAGTGPFQLKQNMNGEYVILERFDGYWGNKAKIDEVKFMTVTEEGTRVIMLENGEADFVEKIPPQDIARLKDNKNISVRQDASMRVAQIGFNIKKAPFDKVKVRQAINYAINRDLIVKGICGGVGVPADSVVAPNIWGYWAGGKYDYDPQKAKQLLAEAGYPNGFKATLWTPKGRYFRDKETALGVAGQLKKVGIDLEVEVIDWGQYLKELRIPNDEGNKVDSYLLGWTATTGEVGYLINLLFDGKNMPPVGWNTMFYANNRVNEINKISSSMLDDEQRKKLFVEFQSIVMKEAPWAPLYVYEQISASRSDLKGVSVFPDEIILFNNAYIQ